MVEVQIARRQDAPEIAPLRRRKRASTLRSIRELLIDDHYALLAAAKY